MSQPTIPRKEISEPSYPVHRPSSAGPSSSTQPQFQQHYHDDPNSESDGDNNRPNTPPPYSGPSTPSLPLPSQPPLTPQPQTHYPGLPRLNYSLYAPSQHGFTLSSDLTTITTHSAVLSKSPTALLPLIQSLCSVPPKPVIRILGKSPHGTVDFDVKLNCMNLIWTDEEKARMNYVKCIGPGEVGWRGEGKMTTTPDVAGLEQWVKRFCKESGAIKQFILERSIPHWDTTYLEGRLLSLIASTSYRGHVSVSFYLTHSKVIIHSPDKYNRFLSNVTKVFTGSKKYEVVKSIWPYADVPRGERARRCVVQDEERWFSEWKGVIRYAVIGKRVGWVTAEDRLEELMEPRAENGEKMEEWGGY